MNTVLINTPAIKTGFETATQVGTDSPPARWRCPGSRVRRNDIFSLYCCRRKNLRSSGLIRHSTQAGFTLLEIMIVFLLMTMIFGLTTVYFVNRLPSAKFDAAVREMIAAIKHARSLAMADKEIKTFTIDMDQRVFGIEGLKVKNIPEDIGIKVKDPFSGEITKGRYLVKFYAGGSAGGGTIILSSDKKKQSIQLDPVVGAVSIKSE